MPACGAAEAVGHVPSSLFMGNRYEANARRGEEVEGVHIGGADDAEHMRDPLRGQRLDEGFTGGHPGHRAPPMSSSVRGRLQLE